MPDPVSQVSQGSTAQSGITWHEFNFRRFPVWMKEARESEPSQPISRPRPSSGTVFGTSSHSILYESSPTHCVSLFNISRVLLMSVSLRIIVLFPKFHHKTTARSLVEIGWGRTYTTTGGSNFLQRFQIMMRSTRPYWRTPLNLDVNLHPVHKQAWFYEKCEQFFKKLRLARNAKTPLGLVPDPVNSLNLHASFVQLLVLVCSIIALASSAEIR